MNTLSATIPIAAPRGAGQKPSPGAERAARRTSGVSKRIVAATVAGNALEFYDFVTYAFFAVYIGRAFFPGSTPVASLLLSVAVFGVGFVSRPLGGVLIGAFADRAGRRPALLLTIALITVGTLGLALTPGYAQIGIAAPLIVVACRLVQGLALGGEVGPSTAFLIEAAPPRRRGWTASWQLASQGIATLVAGVVGIAMIALLSPEQLQAWGWRVPFLLGLALLPVAVFLRRAMPETLHEATPDAPDAHATASAVATTAATTAAAKNADAPSLTDTLMRFRALIGFSMLIIAGGTVANYVGNYMTTFAMTTLKFTPLVSMGATVVVGLATLVFAMVGGWLSDRFGRRPVMIYPRLILALVAVPSFLLLIRQPSLGMLLAVSTLLAALSAISGTASLVAIPELLPRRIRASGISIVYAIGVALFGGTTQFVVTWLIEATGNRAAPAWYLAATSLVAVLAMFALPETRDRVLED